MSNIWGSPPTLIAPKCPSPQWQGSSIYTICADRISYDVVKKNIPLMLGGDAYVCAAENVSGSEYIYYKATIPFTANQIRDLECLSHDLYAEYFAPSSNQNRSYSRAPSPIPNASTCNQTVHYVFHQGRVDYVHLSGPEPFQSPALEPRPIHTYAPMNHDRKPRLSHPMSRNQSMASSSSQTLSAAFTSP